jgi:hypothetical protein
MEMVWAALLMPKAYRLQLRKATGEEPKTERRRGLTTRRLRVC